MYVPGRTQGRREGNMKWVKNKVVASTSASRPFLISHVLPPSWLTRFKQMSLGSGQQRHATKPNPKSSIARLNFNSSAPPFTSPNLDSGGGRGGERFYGGDDDAFWRLSFGYECEAYGDKKYVSEDDDDVKFPPSSCCARSNRVGCRTGEEEEEVEVLPAVDIRTPGLRSLSLEEKKEMKARRSNSKRQLGSEVVEAKKKQGRNAEAESAEVKQHRTASVSNSSSKAENMELVAEILSSAEWGELKDTRKSVHISGEPMQRKQSRQGRGKVRVGSPRTPETFKIRGTEEMKVRAKRKTKPPEKSEGFDWLKSFAVVKSSYDPQNDFTESMVEMIEEMGIRKAEELEELLACYLTLNSEEYHELIIKVFRQVWFHLNHVVAAAYNHRDLS